MTMSNTRWLVSPIALAAATFSLPSHALSPGVMVESVNIFTSIPNDPSCNSPNLCNSIANGNGFQNELVMNGWFTRGNNWQNMSVYDTDFVDPQKSGQLYDNDMANFDRYGTSVSYFTGHGTGGGATHQPCNHNYECTSPPTGMKLPGDCNSYPGYQQDVGTTLAGRCTYNLGHNMAINPGAPGNNHSGLVDYTANGGVPSQVSVAWGESANSGIWSGAGTNGGANLLITDMSYGTEPGLAFYHMYYAMAGAHLFGTNMPTSGDTGMVADRGAAFAHTFTTNASVSIAHAWIGTIYTIPDGIGCPGSGMTHGGMNGCGCNVMMASNSTNAKVSWSLNSENWWDVQEDGYDSQNNGYYAYVLACNYDSVQYPLGHP